MGLFSELPGHNQLDVLKKLEFEDFVKFKQCSKETVDITRDFRHRLPMAIRNLKLKDGAFKIRIDKNSEKRGIECILEEPLRLDVWQFHPREKMSNQQYTYLEEIHEKTKLRVEKYNIYEGDAYGERNDPSMIDNLIKFLNPVVVDCSSTFILMKLNELARVKRVEATYMESDHFLKLKVPEITFPHSIDAHHVNAYFKQWLEGEREIEYMRIFIKPHGRPRAFSDLEFSVLWSWESPELGPFTHLKTLFEERKLDYIHSLERNDGAKIFILMLFISNAMEVVVRRYEDIKEIEECITTNDRVLGVERCPTRWFGFSRPR